MKQSLANYWWLKKLDKKSFPSMLSIGCGKGETEIELLKSGVVENITGVDPYIAGHGNSSSSYMELKNKIQNESLQEKLIVQKTTIQDFLTRENLEKYDLVFANHSLHHIVPKPHDNEAVYLLRTVREKLLLSHGILIIGEVGRGPLLYRWIKKRYKNMDYTGKRQIEEWNDLLYKAGFTSMECVFPPSKHIMKYSQVLWPLGVAITRITRQYFVIAKNNY